MIGRMLKFGIVFAPLGLALVYVTSLQENQDPWLIAVGIYLVIGVVVGNAFVFFGGHSRKKAKK